MLTQLKESIAQATDRSHALAATAATVAVVWSDFTADPHLALFLDTHWWAKYILMLISGIGAPVLVYYRADERTQP